MSETFNLNKALLAVGVPQEDIDTIHSSDPDRVNRELPLTGQRPGWDLWVESLPEGDGTRYLGVFLHYSAKNHPTAKPKACLVYDRTERRVGTDFPVGVDRGEEVAVWHTTRASVLAALRRGTPRLGKPAQGILEKMLAHMA